MGPMYLKVSLVIKEEIRRKSVLLAKTIIIFKPYNCHGEAKGWMGSQVVLPRGNKLHVTPKRHQSKPSLKAFRDHDSSPS